MFGVGWPWMLYSAGRWIGGRWGADWAATGSKIGLALGLAVFSAVAVSYYRFERKKRSRGKKDFAERIVQEISVQDPKVIEIGLISDNEPILCFEIGGGTLLYLQGQWLRDSDTYGVAPPEGDPDDDTINGLSGTAAFPSSNFLVTRLPHSGRVLGIRTFGRYVPPDGPVEALKSEYIFGDSELFHGELSEIGQVLENAHQRSREQQ